MTAVTFPLCPPRLAFAICGWRWQNDVHEIKYSVCVCVDCFFEFFGHAKHEEVRGARDTRDGRRRGKNNAC